MGIKDVKISKRLTVSFVAYKNPLAGYREIFLLPSISTIDTLWLKKDTDIKRIGIGITVSWLRWETGIRFWREKK